MCFIFSLIGQADPWDAAKTLGVPAVIALMFALKDWYRSKADSARMEAMEQFIRQDLKQLNEKTIAVTTEAAHCLAECARLLEKLQ